ncbi:tetratricopeptide repeat protein [Streptomyces sp. NPDC046465]|uniref:tetratricopeptide repeat protein n=1 Tax=Streptomyces sp. NPDC046465 TaxID=3155810 RepID=UPI0033F481B4
MVARPAGMSLQEVLRRRRRSGFVGRRGELGSFRENFDLPVDDERHSFLFHVHGLSGVGKTFLVRELEQIARERGALTAYVDEAAGSLPEVMGAVSAEFARQGRRCKDLDRELAAHRERRREAESLAALAAAGDLPSGPGPAASVGSMAAARAGLAGLGLVPGIGPFAGALDPAQLAQGADRLRAGIGNRLRGHDEAQSLLSPERALTPVLLGELSRVAADAPWLVLFFDTYERTAPFLDRWLHDVLTTERHGTLPANTVIVTAGQRPFDAALWGDSAGFVADLPLEPFTDAEARGLLAARGVTAEPVVEEVLRLSGRLPVLVSTLAASRPADADDVGDPSATAVERFLKWEPDPARREAALACALPRGLDADVFGAAVECAAEDVMPLFDWLRGLPFVHTGGGRARYHDAVRAPMLRLLRSRSPRGWAERHRKLHETFGQWRAEAEARLAREDLWADDGWRELRLAESYHLLCAQGLGSLPKVLVDILMACGKGEDVARRWARALEAVGQDADAEAVGAWGRDLLRALDEGGTAQALWLLLDRIDFDPRGEAAVRSLRGRHLRDLGRHAEAAAEFTRALELHPEQAMLHSLRSWSLLRQGGHEEEALRDARRAVALEPGSVRYLRECAWAHSFLGRFEDAEREADRALGIDGEDADALVARGVARTSLCRYDLALEDLDRALANGAETAWVLVLRARALGAMGEPERQLRDLDRAVALGADDEAWVFCQRGDVLRDAGRDEDALADYRRALELDPDYTPVYSSRAVLLSRLRRYEEERADWDRVVERHPDVSWVRVARAAVLRRLGAGDDALADLDRAGALTPDDVQVWSGRGAVLSGLGRFEEALAALDRAVELAPDDARVRAKRAKVRSELALFDEALSDLDRALGLAPEEVALHAGRVAVHLAVGRLDQALTGLSRCVELGAEPAWAAGQTCRIQLHQGRIAQALAALSGLSEEEAGSRAALSARARAHRAAGDWDAAVLAAERLRPLDAARGSVALALAVAGRDGVVAAVPLWREAEPLVLGAGFSVRARAFFGVRVASGLGDWAELDAGLATLLASCRWWEHLADLAADLRHLRDSPGADRGRLEPCLTRVTAARDEVRARHAVRG